MKIHRRLRYYRDNINNNPFVIPSVGISQYQNKRYHVFFIFLGAEKKTFDIEFIYFIYMISKIFLRQHSERQQEEISANRVSTLG